MQTTADHIIGRSTARNDLNSALEAGERCVTLRGPGGVGKTTIARNIASERNGVFIELEPCRSVEDIAVQIADVLHLPEAARNLGGVQAALSARDDLLIVLDNAEHVIEQTASVVTELLRGTVARFLVTSRVRIGLDEEFLYELRPLAPDDALQLFETRANAALPSFEVDAKNRDDIAELVSLLDGLPLAVELAAARVRVLTPGQILERLGQQFELLRNRHPDVDRHATLDACIDWSWQLLSEGERTTLTQASIFRGGFTMEDAEAVIAVDEWVGDALERLVEHSLIRVDHRDRRTRFTMYDSVRRYVDRHAASDEDLSRRLAQHLLAKTAASTLEHYDLANVLWVFQRTLEFEPNLGVQLLVNARRRLLRGGFEQNLFEAITKALQHDISVTAQARLTVALATVQYTRMEYHACERALARAEELLADVPEEEALEPRARMLLLLAVRMNERHEADAALEALTRARQYLDELPDSLAAHTLAASGIAAMKAKDFEASARFFDDAIERASRTPDVALRARTLSWSAFAPMCLGDIERAIDRLEESLRLFRQTEDYVSTTQARYTLAQALLGRDRERALLEAREAESVARKAKMRILEAMTRIFVARVGNGDDAPGTIRRALQAFGDNVSNSDRWSGWSSLIVVYAQRSDFDHAISEAEALLATLRKYGGDEDYQRAARYAAVVAALAEDGERARAFVAEGDVAFAEALEEVIAQRSVTEETIEAFSDPYARLVLDYLPLPFELYREVRDKQRRRRTMTVFEEGNVVVLPDGEQIELESRYVLRRLVFALCRFHDDQPGVSMTLEELVEAGWPDETMTYESGIRRVYSAVRNIRKLGLEEVLLTGENGYLIDPDLNIVYDPEG